jgi:hypothetical protein
MVFCIFNLLNIPYPSNNRYFMGMFVIPVHVLTTAFELVLTRLFGDVYTHGTRPAGNVTHWTLYDSITIMILTTFHYLKGVKLWVVGVVGHTVLLTITSLTAEVGFVVVATGVCEV